MLYSLIFVAGQEKVWLLPEKKTKQDFLLLFCQNGLQCTEKLCDYCLNNYMFVVNLIGKRKETDSGPVPKFNWAP